MSEWRPIETAPKDGTPILAFGDAFKELAEKGSWFTHREDAGFAPFTSVVFWIEGWYDKEIDNGDGTYRKERARSYAYWGPHAHAFRPTHWMPLPDPPPTEPSQ